MVEYFCACGRMYERDERIGTVFLPCKNCGHCLGCRKFYEQHCLCLKRAKNREEKQKRIAQEVAVEADQEEIANDDFIERYYRPVPWLERGQWLLTCRFEPLRFDRVLHIDDFGDIDDFVTTDGSSHSVFHCGLTPISDRYAEWMLAKGCDKWFMRIQNAKVSRLTEWVRVGPRLWQRISSDPDIAYVYERYGKNATKSQLLYLDLLGMRYITPHGFRVTNWEHVWDAYRWFVAEAAWRDKIEFEGV